MTQEAEKQIKKFFLGVWRLRKECGHVAIQPYASFFFDALPNQPVVFYNYCQMGEKNQNLGITVCVDGQQQSFDLEIKVS